MELDEMDARGRWHRLPILIAGAAALAVLLVSAFLTFGDSEYPGRGQRLEAPATTEELSLVTFTEVGRQLRYGTTGRFINDRTSWSSQPGAIRAYGGSEGEIFKLYSAEEMLVPEGTDLGADVPVDWDTQPDQFVDLNSPSVDGGGELVFPIADPRAFTGQDDGAEGFSYAEDINGVVPPDAAGGSHDGQRLPMPVRWRYVMRDGDVGTLDEANRWAGPGTPSEGNPIVGRVAYWTDDLSSRINVNTASEGVYWDTPRADTLEERAYAENQPARDEFQRQPGHPAQVSLSSVLFPNQRYYLPGTDGDLDPLPLADAEQLWRIAPGVGTGGSKGGTRRIAEDEPPVAAEAVDYHVYESLDDVLASNPALPPAAAQRVARGGFLLTTASNSPETTLMGFPKIAMWPVPESPGQRSAFDQKIAQLATLQDIPYFFQRRHSQLIHGEFYTTGSSNNVRLSEFLTDHGEFQFPGYEGSRFTQKYQSGGFGDWQQLTLAILGYIRGSNLSDPTAPLPYTPAAGLAGHGQTAPLCHCGGTSNHQSIWWQQFSPYALGGARSYSISEVALVIVVSGYVDGQGARFGDSVGLSSGERRFEVGLVLETFCPGLGVTQIRPLARMRATNDISGGTVSSTPIALTIDLQEYESNELDSIANDDVSTGGSGGLGIFTTNTSGEPLAWTRSGNPEKSFKVAGPTMNLDRIGESGNGFFIIIEQSTSGASYSRWQIFSLRNSDTPIPMQIPAPEVPADPTQIGTWAERLQAAALDPQSLIREGDVVRSFVLSHGDSRIVHSRRFPALQNVRVSGVHFTTHPKFADPAEPMSHSLVDGSGRPLHGFKAVRGLVDGAPYDPAVQPDFVVSPDSPAYPVPRQDPTLEFDPSVTGDYDTGIGRIPDGAYTNHPDPGVYFTDGSPYFASLNDPAKTNTAVFSPQRTMPGPGMLGSLPTGGSNGIPWRTLLLRPDPQHYGSGGTPDHLILDQFWMPVPEPHGISHDYSTDGKINMNYAIAPFSHIRRATAMHALLKAEKLMAIPTGAASVYKTQISDVKWRHFIDTEQTLAQFEQRFADGDFFRSASEICEQYLVPEGQVLGEKVDGDYPGMRAFWEQHKLTGDNVKERPYTNLHSRLTTKSNHFKVYAIVQPITKAPGGDQAVFDAGSDTLHEPVRITAGLRRLLDGTPDCDAFDQENRGFPNYLAGSVRFLPGLDDFYRYSIVDAQPDLRAPIQLREVEHAETGAVTIRWRARGADGFIIERSTDMKDWQVIEPDFGGESPWTEFVDESPPPTGRAYYRVRRK